MITKAQLRDKVDGRDRFTHTLQVPWEQTSLARLYDHLDASIEAGCLIDIISAKPIKLDKENDQITVELVLDCSDILQEESKIDPSLLEEV